MDEETRYEAIMDAQAETDAEMLSEANAEENDLAGMFADIEMKLKTIAETLQGQIDEMRQRIEALENKLEMQSKNKA